jgi:hypothetical protein
MKLHLSEITSSQHFYELYTNNYTPYEALCDAIITDEFISLSARNLHTGEIIEFVENAKYTQFQLKLFTSPQTRQIIN